MPKPTLGVWANTEFEGFWVGAAAVVVAETARDASRLLNAKLKKIGLPSSSKPSQMVKIDLTSRNAIVLHNGDY